MLTLTIMTSFKGTKKQAIKATLICIALDLAFLIPAHYITTYINNQP